MTAELLFNRQARLTLQAPGQALYANEFNTTQDVTTGIIIENLAIEFDIEHNLTKHPNQCTIKIMNLTEETRIAISRTGLPLKMTLEAGYEGGLAMIFSGDVTYILSARHGADWVTELQGGDGDHVSASARVNKTYAPGTTVGKVLSDLFGSIDQHVPDVIKNNEVFGKKFNNGLALSGKIKDQIPKILKPFGYTWCTQDGNPIVLRDEDTVGESLEISEATGMIDAPEFGKPERKTHTPTVTIHSLLFPRVRAGFPIKVHSLGIDEQMKVIKVKHIGQTHGTSWFTQIEAKPIALGKSTHQTSANSASHTKKSS